VMAECRQPVSIITKNRLVVRDLDLLQELAKSHAAAVGISITTLSHELAAKMEPRASSPRARLEAVEKLASAGVPVRVMMAPIVPGLTDHEIPAVLKAAAEAGAEGAGYVLLRLPHQVKALFLEWLERHFPDRAAHIESQIREGRGGRLYDSRFFARQRGEGARAEQIGQAFKMFRTRCGLDRPSAELSNASFRRPTVVEEGQLGLF
jgi:DNA repair photolyase